jgi:hypothetical protein
VSSEEALLVAANPSKYYQITPTRVSRELGEVEFHRTHRNLHGGVFWDVLPQGPGHRDAPWNHPGIHSGYFYVAGEKMVRYWMNIESVRRWSEIDQAEIDRYAPDPRRAYLQAYPDSRRYYAILIREINELVPGHPLQDFTLISTNRRIERLRNYSFVIDPGWR